MRWVRCAFFALATAALTVSCSQVTQVEPSTQPSTQPTSLPGVLTVSPATVSLGGTGATFAQAVSVVETNYAGSFSESNTCTGVATISPSSASGPAATFTVTGSAVGTCAATISAQNSQHVTIDITVTTVGVGVQ